MKSTLDPTTIPWVGQCDFCDELSGSSQNSFAARYQGELRDRTVLSTNNFRVIPSLGQIVEGYLLVLPIAHYQALADMPIALLHELRELCGIVRQVVLGCYGPSVMFEHGTRTERAGGCGFYHAHLHVVPIDGASGLTELLKHSHPCRKLGDFEDISRVRANTSYLYYEDARSERYIFTTDYLPSQYMRRLLADALGKTEWDWRKSGKEQALLATVARISKALTQPALRATAAEEYPATRLAT